mmetsp:Transcript_7826/g.19486  ORF Transcript_7826/g.19486 Transcript_7826/m.19486 type:complete len:209 (-) Transcript_7826:1252-1878(-)
MSSPTSAYASGPSTSPPVNPSCLHATRALCPPSAHQPSSRHMVVGREEEMAVRSSNHTSSAVYARTTPSLLPASSIRVSAHSGAWRGSSSPSYTRPTSAAAAGYSRLSSAVRALLCCGWVARKATSDNRITDGLQHARCMMVVGPNVPPVRTEALRFCLIYSELRSDRMQVRGTPSAFPYQQVRAAAIAYSYIESDMYSRNCSFLFLS